MCANVVPRKRSVDLAVKLGWVGWDRLVKLIRRIPERDGGMGRSLAAILFLGGFRVSEVVGIPDQVPGLEEKQVRVVDDFIVLERVMVLKKWRYTDEFDEQGRRLRERVEAYTTRAFPIDEPLTPYFMDWVWTVRRRGDTALYPISRFQAYRIIRDNTGLFPHFLRAQRAIQLVVEYGWSDTQLRSYFKWTNVKTISRYADLGAREILKAFPADRAGRWRM